MTKFLSLYSSISGNSILISNDDMNVLIDAGVSAAKISASLNEAGIDPETIDAIFVTHEHSDHISGIRVLSKKYNIPVYANALTMEGVLKSAPSLAPGLAHIISAPGVWMQRITTKEPDDSMLECAVWAMKGVLDADIPLDTRLKITEDGYIEDEKSE